MKKITIIIFIIALIPVIFLIKQSFPVSQKPDVKIDGHIFYVLIAKTLMQKTTGLGNRKYLHSDQGMLFPFKTAGNYGFWMKNMEFGLDIIYINKNKIINIYTLSKPLSNQNLETVFPSSPANNVLEINQGLAKKYKLKIGDDVLINL